MTHDLPVWLQQLAGAAAEIDGTDLSRFLPPEDGTGRASAVLIAFTETGTGTETDTDEGRGPAVVLLERASDMRHHAGQVAFPGGSIDPDDDGPVAAALREAHEEVGMDPAGVRVVAELPAIFIPVTQFVVTPVLAWWEHPHELRAGAVAEVARVAIVPVAELAEPANRFRVSHPSGFSGPGFAAQGLFIWGFTAGLLDRLIALAGWAQPWDEQIVRALPNLTGA